MKIARGAFGLMDLLEGIGYIAAFFIVLGLLLTGHIPHDLELLAGAGLGALLLFIVGGVFVQRWRRRREYSRH